MDANKQNLMKSLNFMGRNLIILFVHITLCVVVLDSLLKKNIAKGKMTEADREEINRRY
jgi:hypothetical protein